MLFYADCFLRLDAFIYCAYFRWLFRLSHTSLGWYHSPGQARKKAPVRLSATKSVFSQMLLEKERRLNYKHVAMVERVAFVRRLCMGLERKIVHIAGRTHQTHTRSTTKHSYFVAKSSVSFSLTISSCFNTCLRWKSVNIFHGLNKKATFHRVYNILMVRSTVFSFSYCRSFNVAIVFLLVLLLRPLPLTLILNTIRFGLFRYASV